MLNGSLRHKPLKEEIFDVLHQRIISGAYSPGEWLRQEDIAEQMGVSMTPVREALDLLAAAGLAERVPYRGVHVVELTPREIVEAYGMRVLLEGLAARMAASRITPGEVQRLEGILEEMQRYLTPEDMSRSRQLSREFHFSVVSASGDGLLIRLYGIVANSFPDWMLYEAMFRHPDLLASSITEEHAEHRDLMEALAQHDAGRASQVAVRHVLHLGNHLESLLGIPDTDLRKQEEGIFSLTSD